VLQGERMAVVAQGPWLGRDGFVAETAVQFDRVNATIARLEREVEKSREALAEMAEEANRVRRLQAFEETIKNSRDYKITDLQRWCRDLKQRLDLIEGDKSTYIGLTYRSFVAIDRKLAELSALQTQFEQSERNARRYLMIAGIAAAAAVVGFGVAFI
jgi:chromosome segregation ATPase